MTTALIKMVEGTKIWVEIFSKTMDNLLTINRAHTRSTAQCQLTITLTKTKITQIDMPQEKKMILDRIMIFLSNMPIKERVYLNRISFISSSPIISNKV